jgi:hypothetical protein
MFDKQRPRINGLALFPAAGLDSVFESLHRRGFDYFALGFSFKDGLFLCEGIDTFVFGCGGFRPAPVLPNWVTGLMLCFEFFVYNFGQSLQNGFDLLLLDSAFACNCVDKFSLAHMLCCHTVLL